MPWDPSFRVIAHIDMDAFFASVEILDDPSLRGKPVIVGGTTRRGVVTAASYEARVFGVHSAMPVFEARRLCPHGIFLAGRMRRYRDVSRVVMACLQEFTPLVEQVSVDEAFMDLTGTGQLFGPPEKAAWRIKKSVFEETALTCSVGVSVNKLLAKVATEMNKPDGLTVVPPDGVQDFLARLPIGKVPGIGTKGVESLTALGVRTVGDLRRFDPGRLVERFGRFGSWLAAVSRGEGSAEVLPYTEPKSVSAEETLDENTGDKELLKDHMLHQAERVARSLRRSGLSGRTVTLKIKFADFRQITRSVTLDRTTHLAKVIYEEGAAVLDGLSLGGPVRLVGIGVSNLEPAAGRGQLDLFAEARPGEAKWEKVERAVDAIVERFGSGAVRRGRSRRDESR